MGRTGPGLARVWWPWFVYSWDIMNRNTMWVFVLDAPRQAGGSAVARLAAGNGPIWIRLWLPLWEHAQHRQHARTLLGILDRGASSFPLPPANTTPSALL